MGEREGWGVGGKRRRRVRGERRRGRGEEKRRGRRGKKGRRGVGALCLDEGLCEAFKSTVMVMAVVFLLI